MLLSGASRTTTALYWHHIASEQFDWTRRTCPLTVSWLPIISFKIVRLLLESIKVSFLLDLSKRIN